MNVHLLLSGRPRLTIANSVIQVRPIVWRLFAVLGASPPEGIARKDAIPLIWASGGLSDLRRLIWDIRIIEKAHGVSVIGVDNRSVWLSPHVRCDIHELASGQTSTTPGRLYRGRFLDVLDDGHPVWNAWISDQRERVRDIYVARATQVVADPSHDRTTQTREAQRLIEVDPTSEIAARALILDAALNGGAEAIDSLYRNLRSALERVNAKPQDETIDLVTRLDGVNRARRAGDINIRDPGVPTICIRPPMEALKTRAARLAGSLATDVTIGLCRNSLFRVMAPHSARRMSVTGSDQRLADAKVSYLVAIDCFQHSIKGQQILFTLSFVKDGHILWTDSVDAVGELSVEAYNLLTAGILRALVQHVDQAEYRAFSIDADPSAYVLYLAGSRSLASLDLREIRRGRQLLRKAVSDSPRFAPTSSALARSCQLEWILTARGDHGLLAQAQQYSHWAISADPYEARGHKELGFCSLYSKNFDAALDHYGKAEQLNPQYADCLAEYADCLLHCGEMDLALRKIHTAIELNPLCQDTYHWTLGATLFFLQRYREAIETLHAMEDQVPVQRLLAAAYALNGDREAAERCRIATLNTHPDMTVENWVGILPIRDRWQADHYRNGLKQAGFN